VYDTDPDRITDGNTYTDKHPDSDADGNAWCV